MVDGWRIAIAGGATFLVVAVLVPIVRRIALAQGITDNPERGKAHASPTPYLGGVAIALGAVACSLVLSGWEGEAAAILAAAALVAITGLFDDIRTVRPGLRLLVEAGAATVAAAAGARVQLFGGPADWVITIVWIVVITNSFNLLDNMDAAAGSIATTIAIALAVTALLEGQMVVGGLAVVIAAACLAFLIYNWHPAQIFMGDAGSLFLGYLLAVVALALRTPVPHTASIIAVLLLVGPAVFDTTLVVISRVSNGRRIFIGGTDHTSHRLVLLGFHRVSVTAILVAGTMYSCGLGILVAEGVLPAVVGATLALVPGVVTLVVLLRVGEYLGDSEGRGQLVLPARESPESESGQGSAPGSDPPAPISRRHLVGRRRADHTKRRPS